jgi:hypothetical protein
LEKKTDYFFIEADLSFLIEYFNFGAWDIVMTTIRIVKNVGIPVS